MVGETAVKKIISGAAFDDKETLWVEYSKMYWQDILPKARGVFSRMFESGKIELPRLKNQPAPDSSGGIWMINGLQIGSEDLKEVLDVSDYFLTMTLEKRNAFFEFLPDEAVKKLEKEFAQPMLKNILQNVEQMAREMDYTELYRVIRNRLKQFFQSASDFEKLAVFPFVLQLFSPFLRKKMLERKSGPMKAIEIHPNHSVYRQSGK